MTCFASKSVSCLHKKVAFTLAEVLITLGIIGVVAAITLPTLVANYQKTVWVNQLKKAYTTLNEGLKRIAANDGCTTLGCAGLKYYDDDETMGLDFSDERTKEKIVKEFKLENVFVGKPPSNSIYNYEIKHLFSEYKFRFRGFSNDSDSALVGTTPSGEIIAFNGSGIRVDINGLKSPNILGRDIFQFGFGNYNDSTIAVPAFSNIYNSWHHNYSNEAARINGVNAICSIKAGVLGGPSCAEKIIMDGWKMNY